MKKLIFIIVLMLGVLAFDSATATCFLSEKENITNCTVSGEEKCCTVEYYVGNTYCFEAWCRDVTQCEWQIVINTICFDPDQSAADLKKSSK